MKLFEKRDLRREYIKARENLPELERRALSSAILKNLLTLKEIEIARVFLLFCPVRGEPDISPLFSWVLERGRILLLPKVDGERLKLVRVGSGMELTSGAFCIPEPSGDEVFEPQRVELSIIPGIAFDREGYRLGFGRGFYDRLMGELGGLKVGVCYEFQLLEEVPRDSWDRPVDLVVTEKNIYKGGKAL